MSKEIFLTRAILHIIFSWIAKPVIFISDLTVHLNQCSFIIFFNVDHIYKGIAWDHHIYFS